ncbi:MAG: alkene reductase [Acidobacteria bacterium]|nr:alkene reductase [Acidobacteriota bacterium]
MTTIWDKAKIGRLTVPHRFAMAPMTRSRAQPDGTPGPLMAEYYAQRALLGLLISEGTQPSDDGQGYLSTPGIYTDRQVAGWRRVADAVHEAGGRLFIQLMHVGRINHPDNTPHHRQALAPSAVASGGKMFTARGLMDELVPRAMSIDEIRTTINDFAHAAVRAIEAGADGVEIHGANGYLVQQFLSVNANVRDDEYGGSIENRARFAIETASAVANAIGADRTGIRLSPASTFNGIEEGDEYESLYRHLVSKLAKLDLAYVHIVHGGNEGLVQDIRRLWPNALLLNRGGQPLENITSDVETGLADVVTVGRWALANPDFVERYRIGAPMNEPNPDTFYGGDAHGYTDYPRLSERANDEVAVN